MHAFPSSFPHSFLVHPARSRKSSSGASAIQMIIPSGLLISVSSNSPKHLCFSRGHKGPGGDFRGVLSIAEVSAASPPSSLIALLKLLHLVVPVAGVRVIPLKNWASLGDRLTRKVRFPDNRQTAWVRDWRGCSRVPGTLSVPHWCFSPTQMQRVLS